MIRTENLSKDYDGVKAVRNLNLRVERGEIYGFLGPNGAGKTTTILMLMGILRPTGGKIYLFGEELSRDFLALKNRIGVVSEKQYLYKEMTASEYLDFFAELYGVKSRKKRIEELLEAVGLLEVINRKVGAFSRGMQQKLGFARALLHNPDLLILDEPVSGLDPTGIKQIRDLVREENKRGRTIFISSHLLSEVERLCGRVGIINEGRLLAEDTMENLRRKLTNVEELEVEVSEAKREITDALYTLDFVKEVKKEGNKLNIKVEADRDHRADVSQLISREGGVVLSIKVKEMSLEEVFITITEKNIPLVAPSAGGNK